MYTARYATARYYTARYYTARSATARYYTARYATARYSKARYFTALLVLGLHGSLLRDASRLPDEISVARFDPEPVKGRAERPSGPSRRVVTAAFDSISALDAVS